MRYRSSEKKIIQFSSFPKIHRSPPFNEHQFQLQPITTSPRATLAERRQQFHERFDKFLLGA